MREGMRAMPVLERRLDEGMVERVLAVAGDAPAGERIRAGLEAVVELSELNPEATREALWGLRGEPLMLARLEGCLDASPEQATLRLGAAIQVASLELASPVPDLRGRVPELLDWLGVER